jgi:hypothetical protein
MIIKFKLFETSVMWDDFIDKVNSFEASSSNLLEVISKKRF